MSEGGAGPGEARRSARVPGRFWVAVEGVDAEPVIRHGDISATGLFFELAEDIGEVGAVQFLRLASLERACHLHVMAYVVRVVVLADVYEERRGVALEFMPESDDAAANLVDFVRHVLATRGGPKVTSSSRAAAGWTAAPTTPPSAPSTRPRVARSTASCSASATGLHHEAPRTLRGWGARRPRRGARRLLSNRRIAAEERRRAPRDGCVRTGGPPARARRALRQHAAGQEGRAVEAAVRCAMQVVK